MSSCGEYLDQALAVGPISKNFDPNIPPATGEEYIQRVVLEAAKCEDVLVAVVDKSQFKKQTVNIDISSMDVPLVTTSAEWQRVQVSDFAAVRQKLARQKRSEDRPCFPVPVASDETGWFSFCFGDTGETDGGTQPLLTIMLSMNQPLIEQVLEYHVEWLETKSSLSTQQGRWLYALLACLELPLLPEICSLLRSLARECSRIRAGLKTPDDPAMIPLSLFICLVSNYFRQNDLADS